MLKELRFGLVFTLLAIVIAGADDLRSKYLGQSSCVSELQSHRFNIRLDKKQNAYLATRQLNGRAVAMIVQYEKDKDECGVIRDIVQTQKADASFSVECVDPNSPNAVAVGTRQRNDRRLSGRAIEAWSVDLKDLRFVRISGPVTCSSWRSYAGSDQGEDLASWAEQRSAQGRPIEK